MIKNGFHERVSPSYDVAYYPDVWPEASLCRVESLDQFDAERPELVAHGRIDVRVATGNPKASRFGEGGNASHESPANAQNVQVLRTHRLKTCCEKAPIVVDLYESTIGTGRVSFAALLEPVSTMSRNRPRQNGVRAAIAAAAARIMAESGIDNFALAKRKAARQLGAGETQSLPGNDEIEAELRTYLDLYQSEEHPDRLRELRRIALSLMREFEAFSPYLTGPVLKGTAGPYSDIEIQLFPDSGKEVEIFLLNRSIPFASGDARRYSGDRVRTITVLELEWDRNPVKLSLYDSRDERITLKTTQVGKVMERAGIPEVRALLEADHDKAA